MGLSVTETTNVVLALMAVVQASLAFAVWRVNAALRDLHQEQFSKSGPFFRIYFNGFQSQPQDPRKEMLSFMFTIVNEGRTSARVAALGLRLNDPRPGRSDELPIHAIPFEHVRWGPDEHGQHVPAFPDPTAKGPGDRRNDLFIPANDARPYIGFLSAGSGYEKIAPPTLYAQPIGGREAALYLAENWRLFWLAKVGKA